MMRTYLRTFTDEERSEIEAIIAELRRPVHRVERLRGAARRVFGYALLGLAFGASALPFLRRWVTFTPEAVCTVLGSFAASGAFLGYHTYRKERGGQIEAARSAIEYWQARLDRGQYEVTEVSAHAVAAILPMDDEAPVFFYAVRDDEVICLSGDYVQEESEDLSVPRAFSLLRYPGLDDIVRVTDAGEPIAPTRVLNPAAFEGDYYYPEDGEVIRARLATLRDVLQRLA